MSHSSSTAKKAKSANATTTQPQLAERLAKVKLEVKEEPVSPSRSSDNNSNSDNGTATTTNKSNSNNSNNKRGNNKKAAAKTVVKTAKTAAAAAAQQPRQPRVFKTSEARRNYLARNWCDNKFKAKVAIALAANLLPDPLKRYDDATLAGFQRVSLAYISGFDGAAVPLTVGNKTSLHDYHARAYIPSDKPDCEGLWMQVKVLATFPRTGCDAALVARADGGIRFPGRGPTKFLKLSSTLIQLVPKSREEICAPYIAQIRRQEEERRQQQQQQQQEPQQQAQQQQQHD